MNPHLALAAVLLVIGLAAAPARAATAWQPMETIETVRGIPEPKVGIDGKGTPTASWMSPSVRVAVREPELSKWYRAVGYVGNRSADLAVNEAGAAVIASIAYGRISVAMRSAGGPDFRGVEVGGYPSAPDLAGEPRAVIDAEGNATVVWLAPHSGDPFGAGASATVKAVAISRTGVPGPIQTISEPGARSFELDGNRRGDAIVQWNSGQFVAFKRAGQPFGAAERGPAGSDPYWQRASGGITLDGSGNAIAWRTDIGTVYAVRPPQGPFGADRRLLVGRHSSVDVELDELGRATAAWGTDDVLHMATREPGGEFGPARRFNGTPAGADLTASGRGPMLALWQEYSDSGRAARREQVLAAVIRRDGTMGRVALLNVPGEVEGRPRGAINDAGHAAVVWEQRCSPEGAYAVNAAVLSEKGDPFPAPCQDRSPPKTAVRPRRPHVSGNSIRLNLSCSEPCRLAVAASLAIGERARAIPRRALRLRTTAASASLSVRLSPGHGARARRALRRGSRVLLVLRVRARDRFGTAASRRLRLALRR